ncbi:MAG: prepilin peptidase [Clostridia bacterium]|nr:prepilin peptidase [Clostridia bacterium]
MAADAVGISWLAVLPVCLAPVPFLRKKYAGQGRYVPSVLWPVPPLCAAALAAAGKGAEYCLATAFFLWLLLDASVRDAHDHEVPDTYVLPCLALAVPSVCFSPLACLVLPSLLTLLLALPGILGRKCLGGADLKIVWLTGLFLGVFRALPALFFASLLALLSRLPKRRRPPRGAPFAFVPFLFFGASLASLLP